jgi:phospholipase C
MRPSAPASQRITGSFQTSGSCQGAAPGPGHDQRILRQRVFGVEEPNISAWRRQTCGDLTGALNLKSSRKVSFPALPYNYLLNQYVNSQDQNPPVVPKNQTLPTQEPGTRPPVP